MLPELETGPGMGSSPLQRPSPSPHAGWGDVWRQRRLTRKGAGWGHTVLHPRPPLKGDHSPAGPPSGEGGMREPVTHHCRNPGGAWLAWGPWWSLKRDKSSGLERVSSNKAPEVWRLTAGTSPELCPKASSFLWALVLELLPGDVPEGEAPSSRDPHACHTRVGHQGSADGMLWDPEPSADGKGQREFPMRAWVSSEPPPSF